MPDDLTDTTGAGPDGPSHAPAATPSEAVRTSGSTPDADVLPGAEPMSVEGGPNGALVVHGFTGNPQSMRGLATAFAEAGFAVEMPRLPGHGTSLDDMLGTDWDDWTSAAEAAYRSLAERCERVVVAGLSMGGTLTLWLAQQHPEIAGIVLVNPACPPPGSSEETLEGLRALADSGVDAMDAIGGDIADPEASELAYGQAPVKPLISLLENGEQVAAELGDVRCPVLLLTSPQDHVVPPEQGDYVAEHVGGELERVSLDRSYHVATLDHDKDLIEEKAVEFARRATGA